MRRIAVVLGVLGLLAGAIVLWLRPMTSGPPHFTLEHQIELEGTPEEVWEVLLGADQYSDWNPYLLQLTGSLEAGADIQISILQENWEEPMHLTQELTAYNPPRLLAWRGDLSPKGLMQTDHSFHIESLGQGRVRFIQREEFRGKLAELFDEETKGHTLQAFRAMDEALADRVAQLRGSLAR